MAYFGSKSSLLAQLYSLYVRFIIQFISYLPLHFSNCMELRKSHKDAFLKKHNIKLGFMSAFIKASAYALQDLPAVNAVIDDKEIVYRDYIDISVAVATPKVKKNLKKNTTNHWLTSKRGVHLFRFFLPIMRTPHLSRQPVIFALKRYIMLLFSLWIH